MRTFFMIQAIAYLIQSTFNYLGKSSDKNRYIYNAYGIAFDRDGLLWSLYNDFVRNSIVLGVDNSLSSHVDNRKNNFLVLSERPTMI